MLPKQSTTLFQLILFTKRRHVRRAHLLKAESKPKVKDHWRDLSNKGIVALSCSAAFLYMPDVGVKEWPCQLTPTCPFVNEHFLDKSVSLRDFWNRHHFRRRKNREFNTEVSFSNVGKCRPTIYGVISYSRLLCTLLSRRLFELVMLLSVSTCSAA